MRRLKRRKYVQRVDDETVEVVRVGRNKFFQVIRCCDCALVHHFTFAVVKDAKGRHHLFYKAKRDNRATAAFRRSRAPHPPNPQEDV